MYLLLFGRIMKSSFYVWINVLECWKVLYPWTYDNWEINLHCIVMQQTSTRQKLVVSQAFKKLSCIITISLEFVSQDEKWIISPHSHLECWVFESWSNRPKPLVKMGIASSFAKHSTTIHEYEGNHFFSMKYKTRSTSKV